MGQFQDNTGQSWRLAITYADRCRLKDAAKVDLFDLQHVHSLSSDIGKCIDVALLLLESQLKELGLQKGQLLERIGGDEIGGLLLALEEAIVNFTLPQQRQKIADLLATTNRAKAATLEMAVAKAEQAMPQALAKAGATMDAKIQSILSGSSGSAAG